MFQLLNPPSLCFQASELSEHFNGQDAHAAAHAQSGSHSHSRATHSLTYRNPSSISSSAHQTQTQGLSQHQPRVQASDGGVPPGLASTLEHIIGQLDILTQVSRMRVNLSWQTACVVLWLCHQRTLFRTKASFTFQPARGQRWFKQLRHRSIKKRATSCELFVSALHVCTCSIDEARMPWPTNNVFQMRGNTLVWYRLQQKSHHHNLNNILYFLNILKYILFYFFGWKWNAEITIPTSIVTQFTDFICWDNGN